MDELGLIAIGVVLTLGALKFFRRIERDEQRRCRQLAESVLRRHGMTCVRYLASCGTTDPELTEALDLVAASGHIVINHCGAVVGDLCQRSGIGHDQLIVARPMKTTFERDS